jgi:hypothetical protein
MSSNLAPPVLDRATDWSTLIDRTLPLEPSHMLQRFCSARRWNRSWGPSYPLMCWVEDMFDKHWRVQSIHVHFYMTITSLVLCLGSWNGCFTHEKSGTLHMLPHALCMGGRMTIKVTPITIVPRPSMGYKYLLCLTLSSHLGLLQLFI